MANIPTTQRKKDDDSSSAPVLLLEGPWYFLVTTIRLVRMAATCRLSQGTTYLIKNVVNAGRTREQKVMPVLDV